MSTRSQIDFYESKEKMENKEQTARLYHHYDGYPSGRLQSIKAAVEMAQKDYETQGGFSYRYPIGKGESSFYMGDLAAFYILANKEGAGNVEIDNFLHGDIEYFYQVYPHPEGLHVRILDITSGFWDETDLKHSKIMDDGTLDDLYEKYKEE